MGSDVIYAERRGQSQKPEEIYQLIEELVPGGISHSHVESFFALSFSLKSPYACSGQSHVIFSDIFSGQSFFSKVHSALSRQYIPEHAYREVCKVSRVWQQQ